MYPACFDFDVRTAGAQLRLTAVHARFVNLAVQCQYPGSGDGDSASSVCQRQDAYARPVDSPVVQRRQNTEPDQRLAAD